MTSKILPARHVHFAPDQNSGSHRPLEAFRKTSREPEDTPEPINEVLLPSAPPRIVAFPTPIPHLIASPLLAARAREADKCFRKQMAFALINNQTATATDLVTAHRRFYRQLSEAVITRDLDRSAWYAALDEINQSLMVVSLVDRAFIDALKKVNKREDYSSIFVLRAQKIREESKAEELLNL